LRKKSAREIAGLGFPGLAAGGLALGEPEDVRLEAIEVTLSEFPEDRPHYLMGLGTPLDILNGIERGADLFDCVLPTRNARNGQFFTRQGKLNIGNSRFQNDPKPPDENCSCYTCRTFSRSYLRHLFMNREPLFPRLSTIHNLCFYLDLVSGARRSLIEGRFPCYHSEFKAVYA
jgi:queuine tRNA-ribosyltransferase